MGSNPTPSANVRGPRAIKEDVLARLMAVRDDVTNRFEQKHIGKTLAHLTSAIDSTLWTDDSHLVWKLAHRVFKFENLAVQHLSRISRERHVRDQITPLSDALLLDWITRLVNVDRLLAQISMDDAADSGGNARRIAEIRKVLAKGDVDAGNGRTQTAITRYHNAWRRAVRLQVQASP